MPKSETETVHVKYLIKQRSDEVVIEIPRSWKITFANVNPASNMGGGNGHCVRVYEMPGNHLRAVFDSVIAIRDLSIPLARRVRSEVGNSSWSRDSAGNFDSSTTVNVDETFVLEPGDIKAGPRDDVAF